MPLVPVNEPIRPPDVIDPTAIPGEWFAGIVFILGILIFILIIFWILIKVFGNSILIAKSSRFSGDAIIQHFENSKIGQLKLAALGGGALRHKNIADGTLLTIPKGINSLDGLSFVNSWHLVGISIPIFLIGGITKLKQMGIQNRDQLKKIAGFEVPAENMTNEIVADQHKNLIDGVYNFNDFKELIQKSKNPELIPLEIEHVSDFIYSINQHYTEAIITKEIRSIYMLVQDNFSKTLISTAIAVLIVSIAIYFLTSMGG